MKNIKIFCRMTMAVKKVSECNMYVGIASSQYKPEEPCCFVATYYRSLNLRPEEPFASLDTQQGFSNFFGIDSREACSVIYSKQGRIPDSMMNGGLTGEGYYDAAVELLRKKKCLSHLRRMENAA